MATSAPTIVVIDDEEDVREYLNEVLSLDGYECKCFQESVSALAYLSEGSPPADLVMTDIRMPGMDGLELLKKVHSVAPGLPVILISGLYELAIALEAVRSGAVDFLLKPAKPAEVLSLVAKHVQPGPQPEAQAVQAALANFLANYKPCYQQASFGDGHSNAAELFRVLGFRRYETMQHSMRVAAYAVLLGEAYGLECAQLGDLELGALLHDIGKIAIPRNVLLKPAALNEKEWEVMRTHPHIGYQLLADLHCLQGVRDVVHAHHERYDGTGYPRGLKGDQIPVGARLFSIVDTVDAITCDRPYRKAQSFQVAYAQLQNGSSTQFDPEMVKLFLSLPEEKLLQIRDRLPDGE